MIKILCSEKDNGAYADLHWTKQVQQYNPGQVIYCRDFAEGAVVSMREMNGYDDSDFYATYFNAESGEFEEVCYASTRGWTYPCNAVVDATPEIKEAYAAYVEAKEEADRVKREAILAAVPTVGKKVEIVISKGKNKGLNGKVGEVFWYGQNKFARYVDYRVGVLVDGIKVFLSTNNVNVLTNA